MTCQQFHQQVDRLVFGDLPPGEEEALRAHAATCGDCAKVLETQQQLQQGFAGQAIPEPTADFEARIRAMALASDTNKASTRAAGAIKTAPIWGSAVAAVLALGVFIGMQMGPTGIQSEEPRLATSTTTEAGSVPAEPDVRTVRLAFNSRTAMENVTLTLEMPSHAELAPFPGRQTISWKVNLKEGDNVLALPVNVLFPGTGELVAHLDKGELRKTFSTSIPDKREPSS